MMRRLLNILEPVCRSLASSADRNGFARNFLADNNLTKNHDSTIFETPVANQEDNYS